MVKMVLEQVDSHIKSMKLNLTSYCIQILTQNGLIVLYLVGDKTIKLLEENIGINLHYFGFGIVF